MYIARLFALAVVDPDTTLMFFSITPGTMFELWWNRIGRVLMLPQDRCLYLVQFVFPWNLLVQRSSIGRVLMLPQDRCLYLVQFMFPWNLPVQRSSNGGTALAGS